MLIGKCSSAPAREEEQLFSDCDEEEPRQPDIDDESTSNRNSQQEQSHSKKNGNHQNTIDCYAILGIAPTATREEINHAFRELIKLYHPDRTAQLGPELQALASEKSKILNWAHQKALDQVV